MKRYRKAEFTVLASSVHSEGGDWRSIYFLVRHLEMKGLVVPLINLGSKRSFRQLVAALVFGKKVVVNGLGTVSRWPVLLGVFLRSDIAVYLHETEFVLDSFKASFPLRYRVLRRVFRRNPLLCVSRQAEDLYQIRYWAKRCHVIYECPGAGNHDDHFEAGKDHIVMVGSINERKGAELFSKVADLAASKGFPWKFHWIGGMATMNDVYRSDEVVWHGWNWNPRDLVGKCRLFFLASVDDPCPLAALEAGMMGKRMVAYLKTGTAEIINGLPGCRVFSCYDEASAIQAITGALGDACEAGPLIREAFDSVSGIEAFAERVRDSLA